MTHAPSITRRDALIVAATGITSALNAPTSIAASRKTTVLVELFTSQGCSSCPPADRIAAELTKRSDLMVLSFNVDYWDYLGWRDTLAKPEHSQRQYDYARARGDGNVYTPQMIFNGMTHAVGSHRSAVNDAISATKGFDVDMNLRLDSKEVSVSIPGNSAAKDDSTLWLLAVAARKEQVIKRGENAGKTIIYRNVVRNMVPATMWKGETFKGSWMLDAVMTPDSTFCVAVLQEGKTGRVLSVANT